MASNLRDLQQFTNIENGGLGISYFNTIDLKDTLYKIGELKILPESMSEDTDPGSLFSTMYGEMLPYVQDSDVKKPMNIRYIINDMLYYINIMYNLGFDVF